MLRRLRIVSKPIAAAVVTLLVVTLGVGSTQAATLNLSEDFNSGSAPDFTFVPGSSWNVGGGVLNGNTLGADNLDSAAVQITDDLSNTSIVVSTTLKATMLDGNSDVGIAAFGDDATFDLFGGIGHYLVDFKADGNFRILRVAPLIPLSFSTIAVSDGIGTNSGPFSFATTDTYTLTLEATRSGSDLDLTFTIDDPTGGIFSISGTDTSPLTGQYFGPRVRTSGLGVQIVTEYDDFSIVAVPEPSSLALMVLGFASVTSLGWWRKRNCR